MKIIESSTCRIQYRDFHVQTGCSRIISTPLIQIDNYNISLKAITHTKKLYLSDIHYSISFESVYIYSQVPVNANIFFHLYSSFTFR